MDNEITADQLILDLVKSIEERIENLEKAPRMWGSPEAQEFTMLTLLEFRAQLLRPQAMRKNPYEVRNAWNRFVDAINGESTNTYLHVILKEEEKLDLLASLLGDAARWIIKIFPPEVNHTKTEK